MLHASKDPKNFIVLAAAAFEFAPLKEQLKGRFNFSDEQFFEFGVGIHECAANLAANLSKFKGKDILYVGTAGIFGEFSEVKVYQAQTVAWIPTCERHDLSYAVKPEPVIEFHPMNPAFSPAHVICGSNVSLSDQLENQEPDQTYLENIELYTCARLIFRELKTFTAILAVTNSVGTYSHKEWKSNFKHAAEATSTAILKSSL